MFSTTVGTKSPQCAAAEKGDVTFAQFPMSSSCGASAPAAPAALRCVRSRCLCAVSEASCFHVAVE